MKQIRPALVSLALLSLVTGVAYPLAVTAVAQIVFPRQANGSLVVDGGRVVGSSLIGQPFADPRYFWGRLSATALVAYNGAASSGSNYGPMSTMLTDAAHRRVEALKRVDSANAAPVPVDLVTASGSGLDPHISPAAAAYQAARVARARGLPESSVRELVAAHTHGRQLGMLGEPVVDVLALNLALDGYGTR